MNLKTDPNKDEYIVETKRLYFREIEEHDAELIVKWRSDPAVYKFFKSPHEITIDEHLSWFKNIYPFNQNRLDMICIEKCSNNRIGVFGLVKDNDVAEVNYLLSPEAQHKGYANEGIKALIEFSVEKLGVKTVIAEIHKENVASVAVIKKLGFKLKIRKDDFEIYDTEVKH